MKLILSTLLIVLSVQKGLAECVGAGFVTTPSGWLSAPKEGSDIFYENNANCMWLIEVHESKAIQIQFHEMDIEEEMVCEYDYIKVNDGLTPKIYTCGTELPQDFLSDSRLTVIRFKSDGSIRRKGFNLTYSQVEDPTCGYRTWRNVGRFGSFDTDIKSGICTWAIQGPRSYVALHVFVTKWGPTQSENCDQEYIEIYDDNEVFGRYCGLEGMTAIRTTENVLYVDLKSNGNNGTAFEACYARSALNGKCGGILTQPSGNISSYDGDQDGLYDNNQNCVWTIIAPEDNIIRLEFLGDFEVESSNCYYDYVKIYDGPFEEDALYGLFCGAVSPGVIWTTSNILTMQFFADSGVNKKGFNASYELKEERERDCGELLTEPSGVFMSPDVDNNGVYESNQDCLWTLTAPEHQVIYLKFTKFDVEFEDNCGYDYVEVFDGQLGKSASLGKFCGSDRPPVIWSTSNVIEIQFYSDPYSEGAGFTAKYSFYNDKDDFTTVLTTVTTEKLVETTERGEKCGHTYTQQSGLIYSPDEDKNGKYDSAQLCNFTITALKGQVVRLKFSKFDIEHEEDCNFDFVEVFDGEYGAEFSIGRYCNGNEPPVIWSTSNIMVVFFRSDNIYEYGGFIASYSFYNESDRESMATTKITTETFVKTTAKEWTTGHEDGCGAFLTQSSGIIKSPDENNDGNYEINQDCLWTISAPEGQVIYLKFLEFDIEAHETCGFDFVDVKEIVEGEFGGSHTLDVGTYCNVKSPPVIWSTSNVLVVHFHSDVMGVAGGFKATYRFYNASDRDSITKVETTTEEMVETTPTKGTTVQPVNCGGDLTQPSGNIASPDLDDDGNYDIETNCIWTITAPIDQVINFKFLTFDLEYNGDCFYDFVEVREESHGEWSTSETLGKYCGAGLPPEIWSTSNILVVQFFSDAFLTYTGFTASYRFYNADEKPTFTKGTTDGITEESTTWREDFFP